MENSYAIFQIKEVLNFNYINYKEHVALQIIQIPYCLQMEIEKKAFPSEMCQSRDLNSPNGDPALNTRTRSMTSFWCFYY